MILTPDDVTFFNLILEFKGRHYTEYSTHILTTFIIPTLSIATDGIMLTLIYEKCRVLKKLLC